MILPSDPCRETFRSLSTPVRLERHHDHTGHRNLTDPASCLRCAPAESSTRSGHVAAHRERAALEVDVGPAQTEHLPAPQPAPEPEHRTEDRIARLEALVVYLAEAHDRAVDQVNEGFKTLTDRPPVIHANQLVTSPAAPSKPRRVRKTVFTDDIGRITEVLEEEIQ